MIDHQVGTYPERHDILVWSPGASPDDAELAELAELRERFGSHRIFYNVTADNGIRYLAYAARIDVSPHTIITPDLAELRNELEASAPRGLHPWCSSRTGRSAQLQLYGMASRSVRVLLSSSA